LFEKISKRRCIANEILVSGFLLQREDLIEDLIKDIKTNLVLGLQLVEKILCHAVGSNEGILILQSKDLQNKLFLSHVRRVLDQNNHLQLLLLLLLLKLSNWILGEPVEIEDSRKDLEHELLQAGIVMGRGGQYVNELRAGLNHISFE
jgi:hypothetical protein